MSKRALARSLARAVAEGQETAGHCAVTIGARVPVFAGLLVAPTGAALTEWNRACAEKVAAGFEGAIAASFAWQAALMGSAFRMPTAAGLAGHCLTIASKGAAPARKRVKANAKRLTRSKRR